jgi:DNA-binding NarL/FixJ family response regulator
MDARSIRAQREARGAASRQLTPREELIVELVAAGLRDRDIAVQIGTTTGVTKNYMQSIFDKTGLSTRLDVALFWQSRHPAQVPREIL